MTVLLCLIKPLNALNICLSARKKDEEMKLRKEEMIRQDENKKEEMRLKAIELQLACDTKQQNDRCNNKKQFMEQVNTAASTIKHLLEPCPSNLREVPAYFRKIERIFDSHNVEWDHRAYILMMNLDNKMKSWKTNLSGEEMKNYDKVKQLLLQQLHINPIRLRDEFFAMRKSKDENFSEFATQLHNVLQFTFKAG